MSGSSATRVSLLCDATLCPNRKDTARRAHGITLDSITVIYRQQSQPPQTPIIFVYSHLWYRRINLILYNKIIVVIDVVKWMNSMLGIWLIIFDSVWLSWFVLYGYYIWRICLYVYMLEKFYIRNLNLYFVFFFLFRNCVVGWNETYN